MATRFELVLGADDGDDARLRAAGEEALLEIESLEAQLSFYRASSEISWINAGAAAAPVRVEPRLFQLLQRCAHLTSLTDGAFDITVGSLLRVGDAAARDLVGMHRVDLDESAGTIHSQRRGMALDLGGYGKGYAIQRAAAILREHGITCAFLHGGGSSSIGMGRRPGEEAWTIALHEPFPRQSIPLTDQALSVSALHGHGQIMDPRSGDPVRETAAAAVTGPSAADCEALSTALLVLGPSWLPVLRQRFPGCAGLTC